MGGRPSKGTPKDGRLSGNKGTPKAAAKPKGGKGK
jgi:hypothetical protein